MTVEDSLYGRAKVAAAMRSTSLSALVREYLIQLAHGDEELKRRKQLQHAVLTRITNFRTADRVTREEAHSRHALD